jgi:hypothetical protein
LFYNERNESFHKKFKKEVAVEGKCTHNDSFYWRNEKGNSAFVLMEKTVRVVEEAGNGVISLNN